MNHDNKHSRWWVDDMNKNHVCVSNYLFMFSCFCEYAHVIISNINVVVFFLDFSPDGRPQWEVEAKIIREKTQGVSPCFLLFEKKSVKIM